ncbi:RERGL protein, partial [Leiothrix lutea]|nr:RERGL protein [Leiothrix lutea]
FLWMIISLLECIYTKHLCLDGRQIHLEIYDPCSQDFPQERKVIPQISPKLPLAVPSTSFVHVGDHMVRKKVLKKNKKKESPELQVMVEPSIFLVGNKQDLCHMREVGWDEGQKLAIDNKCQFCELSAAEHYQEVVAMFTKVLRNITSNFKVKEKRRPSGSKSMAKLINNMFGKRRKSV